MIRNKTEKLVIAGLFLALGIAVPQLFHLFPVANTGGVLLPMHIPVLLCGIIVGPFYGLIVGGLSPFLSFLLTEMPSAARLPFMVCELMAYGFTAGLFYKILFGKNKVLRVYISLIGAMICGRIVYFIAILSAINIFHIELAGLKTAAVIDALVLGIPGIIIQIFLVPTVVMAIDKTIAVRGRKSLGTNNTFVCYGNEKKVTSEKKGIAPIMELLNEEPEILKGAKVVDRIIGRAAALLLVKGQIKSLYTEIISDHALAVLKKHKNITVSYTKKVPYIINRTKDGMCPMENATLDIEDPEEAYKVLVEKLKN